MSAAVSPATAKAYGVERVCRMADQPRSSFYAWRRSQQPAQPEPFAARAKLKPGPKTALDDAALLARIRADLAASPFQGEGHRKVWARLRVGQGVRVSRKRVLHLMRQNNLLSPWRVPRTDAPKHNGAIITQAPNQMWGTDGARIFTLEQGWVWLFTAVEHWNAECVGWQVAQLGSRFAALEPIAMALRHIFGSLDAGIARGFVDGGIKRQYFWRSWRQREQPSARMQYALYSSF